MKGQMESYSMSVMKVIKGFIKVIAAGIVSVAIINVMLCFYSITPVHEENCKGNTDYVWLANSIWIKATEGIAYGKFDANGFNNQSVVDNPDIIVLGSSHMEATNVMYDENAPFLLSEKLAGKYSVYNMGISGHNFFKVCQYLSANIELYEEVPKVVIVETSFLDVTENSVNEVISSSVEHTPSHSTGVIGILQKIPFCRLLYHQIEGGLLELFMSGSGTATEIKYDAEAVDEIKIDIDESAYEELFSYLKSIEVKYGTQIIIFYHPSEKLMDDGSIYFERNEYLSAFSSYSDEYGISFIDMTNRFETMYYEEKHVAHGFCTGEIATGHLNKYGHAAVADELYNEIIKLEEAGEICK